MKKIIIKFWDFYYELNELVRFLFVMVIGILPITFAVVHISNWVIIPVIIFYSIILASKIYYDTIQPKYWEVIKNAESENGHWELTEFSDYMFRLHYVPKNDYSEQDQFIYFDKSDMEDLIKFIDKIDDNVRF